MNKGDATTASISVNKCLHSALCVKVMFFVVVGVFLQVFQDTSKKKKLRKADKWY